MQSSKIKNIIEAIMPANTRLNISFWILGIVGFIGFATSFFYVKIELILISISALSLFTIRIIYINIKKMKKQAEERQKLVKLIQESDIMKNIRNNQKGNLDKEVEKMRDEFLDN